MLQYTIESYLLLLRVEWIMKFSTFRRLHGVLRCQDVAKGLQEAGAPVQELCHAIDLACVFYLKPVKCLQRSAATTLLLRRHGVAAEMVIGAQLLPFKKHAWVEVDGAVVNDKPYMAEIYEQMERC